MLDQLGLVKMLSWGNGGLSHGNASKRSSENGYCASNSGNAPKYKSRKVSATRDFPLMCGPNSQLLKSEQAKENVVASIGDNVTFKVDCNGVQTEAGVENQPCLVMKSPVSMETNGLGTSTGLELHESVVSPPCAIVGVFPEANDIQSEMDIETPALEVMENHFKMETDASGKSVNFEDLEHVVLIGDSAAVSLEPSDVKVESKVEIQSHEVVGSPVGEEGNESLDMLVERVVTGFIPNENEGLNQVISEVKCMETELVKGPERKSVEVEFPKEGTWKEVQGSAKQLDHGEVVGSVKSMDKDGVKPSNEVGCLVHGEVSVPSPKNKFRRRRVSATRDFPPYCGRNASATPREHLNISSSESLLGVNKVNEEKGKEALKGGAEGMTSRETLPDKLEKCSLEKLGTSFEVGGLVVSVTSGSEAERGDVQNNDFQGSRAIVAVTPPKNSHDVVVAEDNEKGQVCSSREMVLYVHDNSIDSRPPWNNIFGSGHEDDRMVVNALMAAKNCPWSQEKVAAISGDVMTEGKANKVKTSWRGRTKAVAKKTTVKADSSGRSSFKNMAAALRSDSIDTLGAKVVREEGKCSSKNEVPHKDFNVGNFVDVSLPPFGPSSSNGDARKRVRETLRLFQALCRKLLQGEESRPEEDTKSKQPDKIRRIDIEASKILKEKGKEVNTGKQILGPVPGVEVGDEFQYRVELAIVGVHRLYQAGIDYLDCKGMKIATSIVASGGYDDDMENPDILIYSGQGGFKVGKDKQPEDQKLERGNLALWNSKSKKNPVRVIRGSKEKDSDSQDSRVKIVTKYVYDGLYTVENHWKETGSHGKLVFMFELKRIPGQPELAWKELKKSKKARVRHGVCVDDIAGGKELFPICAVNTIDNEKPQPFNYIKKMMYPNSLHLIPPKGCDCIGRCSDSRKCSCALRNGGEIPYNRNGAIVEAKPLVYECGPHCKCSPSCYNRVSQHGIKIHLEIFKTKSRGWGVRSLSSISSGSFICEYVGEILEDKEAEKRTGSDEYLFDIGQNYTDCTLNSDGQENSSEAVEEGAYTIDAAQFANVGRFINHSCSPNLYAQNVLYDHDDKRVPHIMLFAAENIPPLQELTYHYNYVVGQVYDSKGNVKIKSCYCGAPECTGRMY